MVKPKTEEEIELLRENAILVSKTLAEVGKVVAPGVTTARLNEVAETFIRDKDLQDDEDQPRAFTGGRILSSL